MTRTAASATFCEGVGISQPIILAPMGGGPSTPELIAAVSNAGGMGSIAAGYLSPAALSETVGRTRELTSGSVGINIFVPPAEPLSTDLGPTASRVLSEIAADLGAAPPAASLPDSSTFREQVEIAAASDAALVSFTFGLPSEALVAQLHAAGKVVAATANTRAEADAVAATGCDAVILQGFEAGAHRGGLAPRGDRHVGLMALLEQTREGLPIDVIASGGITSGAGVAASLAMGAVAAQIGTAFLVAEESGATPEWKKAVETSVDSETVVTAAVTGRGARAVPNQLTERMAALEGDLPAYPVLNSYTAGLRQRAKELGDPEFQSLWSGQAGSAARPGTATDIFDQLVRELDDATATFTDRQG